jgi:beta-aspartyl-dipeptidase (metallo-type)
MNRVRRSSSRKSLLSIQRNLDTALEEKIPLETALQVITSSAQILRFVEKGLIQEEKDADIVLLDQDTLTIYSCFS